MSLSNFFKRMAGQSDEPSIHLDLKKPAQPAKGQDGQSVAGAPGKERRHSVRVSLPGLEARLKGDRALPVKDLSVTGAGLAFAGKRVKAGTTFHVTLAAGETVFAENLKVKVVRHDQGVLGVAWQELDRHQDEGLHKIVLEAQKRQASLRKSR